MGGFENSAEEPDFESVGNRELGKPSKLRLSESTGCGEGTGMGRETS